MAGIRAQVLVVSVVAASWLCTMSDESRGADPVFFPPATPERPVVETLHLSLIHI